MDQMLNMGLIRIKVGSLTIPMGLDGTGLMNTSGPHKNLHVRHLAPSIYGSGNMNGLSLNSRPNTYWLGLDNY